MDKKQLFDNEYYNSLLQNEIDKIADANGKNVVINITIPQQKEFMTVQDVANMLGVKKKEKIMHFMEYLKYLYGIKVLLILQNL